MRASRNLVAASAALLAMSACVSAPAQRQADEAERVPHAEGTPADDPTFGGPTSTPGPNGTRARALAIGSGWGPSPGQIAQARRLVKNLTLRERAGQVIHASYAGTSAPTAMVNRLHLGGVLVFSENYSGTDQIRASNRALQRSVREAGRAFPVVIGVDQEGGLVERISGTTRFPAFMTAGAADIPRLTRAASAASGRELAGLGFTTDYAPVADVTIGRADPTIGARSAGTRPRSVGEHAVAAASGYWSTGVIPTLKHFPGHGSVTTDSHLTLPVQQKTLNQLAASDFVPFESAVEAGLPSVMVGHIDVRAVDPGVPSSLSRRIVTGLLRGRIGFEGLVVTDSLMMGAVTERWSSGQAAVRALKAGVDVVLMPTSPREARDGIVRAVRGGRLSPARLVQAATRQVALLLHQQAQGLDIAPPGAGRPTSQRWSAAALTSVAGPCRGRLVGSRVEVSGPAAEVARFRVAAAEAGLRVGQGGTTVRLVGFGGAAVAGDVVVATDTPYVLGDSQAGSVKLATYGTTAGAMRALVDVLLGRRTAPGALPVRVEGIPRSGC
ncbi:glycoside hydrolase family 3 protein [soil metagenome]